jgi:predicted HTH domain antitoxin
MNPPLTSLTEVQFSLELPQVSLSHQQVAEGMAREAYVMALLSQGSISAGRAASLLAIDRSMGIVRSHGKARDFAVPRSIDYRVAG